ncbi:MAG TPA: hypothetical protein VFL04_03750 [Rectinemataceae bacterium]|nr:hypothetical protein [Rectinemataceae bacterium]
MRKLNRQECLDAVERGDFDESIRAAAPSVAVVLTQSWCVQWQWMRSYLEQIGEEPGRQIFWVEYDNEDFFEPFMAFKEDVFGNREVPYVRYYRGGQFVKASNFIDKTGFLKALASA